jgi:hypothetical protein
MGHRSCVLWSFQKRHVYWIHHPCALPPFHHCESMSPAVTPAHVNGPAGLLVPATLTQNRRRERQPCIRRQDTGRIGEYPPRGGAQMRVRSCGFTKKRGRAGRRVRMGGIDTSEHVASGMRRLLCSDSSTHSRREWSRTYAEGGVYLGPVAMSSKKVKKNQDLPKTFCILPRKSCI